jgi:hypothetical protein
MSEHRDEAAAARQKARRALRTARRNLEDGDADGAAGAAPTTLLSTWLPQRFTSQGNSRTRIRAFTCGFDSAL